jgi:hypothetical protein
MMKKWVYTKIGSFLAALLLIVLLVAPVWAQDGDFEEDFEGSDLTGWERSPDVIVVDGALRVSAGGFAFKSGFWENFTLTLRVRTNGYGDVNIHYYARDESRYQLHLLPEEIILDRSVGDRGEILGAVGTEAISTGNWIDLTLRVVEGVHELSIENELVLTATESDPLQAGPIGLVFHGEGYAEFDDLALTQEGGGGEGEPPPEGEGEPPREGEVEPPSEGEGEHPPGGEGEPPPEGEEFPPPEGEPPSEGPESGGGESAIDTQGWLEEFLSGQAQPLELQSFVINLLLSAVLAFILGRVYIFWGTSLSNRRKFAANFMLITITTTFIILVVRSSVALSLGLVGALSIVRFRAAIKEPEELAYLFFAIGIGIGLGDNQRLITLLAMVVGILLIGVVRLFHNHQADMNLHLTVASANPEKVDLDAVIASLSSHTAKLRLLRFDETETAFESTFLVEFQDLEKMNTARKALRALSPGIEVTFMDNRGME